MKSDVGIVWIVVLRLTAGLLVSVPINFQASSHVKVRRALRALSLVTAAALTSACGLDLEVSTEPNPAHVGQPSQIKIDLRNTQSTCTIESDGFWVGATMNEVRSTTDSAIQLDAGNST